MPDRAMLQQSLGVPTSFPEMKVGRKIRMQWFDPFTQAMRTAVAEVKGKMTYPWQGKVLTVFMVRTQCGPMKTVALVDANGEIYEYRVFSFTFIRAENKDQSGETIDKPNAQKNNHPISDPKKGNK